MLSRGSAPASSASSASTRRSATAARRRARRAPTAPAKSPPGTSSNVSAPPLPVTHLQTCDSTPAGTKSCLQTATKRRPGRRQDSTQIQRTRTCRPAGRIIQRRGHSFESRGLVGSPAPADLTASAWTREASTAAAARTSADLVTALPAV
jgi:hypothetical protein